ncbi:MAG: VPLPA-CTERM sorting domain-containing protein [Pseudomonadota bacterium]
MLLAAVLAVAGHSAVAATTTVFQDDFQADDTGGTGFSTTTSLTNWTVVGGGNVDILPSAGSFPGCVDTCIDLDGSFNSTPARLETLAAFSFVTGTTYTLTLDIPGGQQADPFTFGILGGPTQSVSGYMAPLSPVLSFTAGADFAAGLFIQMDTSVSNNLGPWLDTVTLTARTPDPGTIPLPAGMWLLLSALGAGVVVRRRRG